MTDTITRLIAWAIHQSHQPEHGSTLKVVESSEDPVRLLLAWYEGFEDYKLRERTRNFLVAHGYDPRQLTAVGYEEDDNGPKTLVG